LSYLHLKENAASDDLHQNTFGIGVRNFETVAVALLL
jgi:hypothetical protein